MVLVQKLLALRPAREPKSTPPLCELHSSSSFSSQKLAAQVGTIMVDVDGDWKRKRGPVCTAKRYGRKNSKMDLQAKLNLASIVAGTRDFAELRSPKQRSRVTKVHTIDKVEKLASQLHEPTLFEGPALED